MALPDFLAPLTALQVAKGEVPLGFGGPGGTSGSLNGFDVEHQTQENWCWAAVSTSVSRYYDSGTTWTQCKVASAELGTECCRNVAPNCDQPWYLDRALVRVGHYYSMANGSEQFADVQGELNSDRPLCCRIGWFGGGGHFVALGAWTVAADGTQYVDVYDPFFDHSQQTYDVFKDNYRSQGNWTHSYRTLPSAGV